MSTYPVSSEASGRDRDDASLDRLTAQGVFDRSVGAAAAYASPVQIFSPEGLTHLTQRSNLKGALQLLTHVSLLSISGYLWFTHRTDPWVGWPALVCYGFGLAAMFAPLHESVHRTAFASNRLNDWVAWFAGLLSFYNSTFYRRYHKWHHRYTRIPGKDPELTDAPIDHLGDYLWHVSGIPWWIGKLQCHWRCATGQFADCPFIPASAQAEVQRSVLAQLLVYGVAIALSFYSQSPWFFWGWVLPLAIGQPLLRLILLAEHTGCSLDANPFANTRTTLTIAPLRLLIWNMSFHAEHHFCPAIPFHALGQAHRQLSPHLLHVAGGYGQVNRRIVTTTLREHDHPRTAVVD
jgi:fatty acid desaturase